MYCAGCAITPYCSERCQRRDWQDRHMSVCHNLASVQPVTPLRRPHAVSANKPQQETEDDFNQSSQASVKSSGSGGKGGFNKKQDYQKQDYQKQYKSNYSQEKTNDEPRAKSYQHDKPKQDFNNKPQNNSYNRTQRTPAKEPEEQKPQPAASLRNKEYIQPTPLPKQRDIPPADEKPSTNLVPKRSDPERPIKKPEAIKPQDEVPTPKESVTNPPALVKPASVSDVTPTRKPTPKNYLLEKLAVGEGVMISVEAKASDSRINRGDYVCLTMAEAFESQYQSLCEDFVVDCDKDDQPCSLVPGETCSYFNPEDGGWYRARCLNPTTVALLDSGKIVTVSSTDKCRRLPSKYEAVPEFCAVLTSKTVEVGVNLSCKILSQTSDGCKVSMADVDTNADLGEGEMFRWLPTVEYKATPAVIPEVERPPVTDGSKVLLVLATSLEEVFVRPADGDSQRKYNDILQQVLLTAMNAQPLKAPPLKGDMVIAKFTDGNHYRALVKRTSVKQNKYQIEYIEYGNVEVSTLENLYPCPSEVDLHSVPPQVSMVKLGTTELSRDALEYIEKIKDEEELYLTLSEGRKTAPSGSEATLTMLKNGANLNNKLTTMSMPDWKKFEESGGDVVESQHVMFDSLVYTELPAAACTVEVLDTSLLRSGTLSGHERGDPNAAAVFNQLVKKMADYCNSELGREPYLPKPEELCIAQLPPFPQWFRAVYAGPVDGPGSKEGKVCYIDYGNLEDVPVSLIRKMMPEFITGYPVMGLHIVIKDFPESPSDEMLSRALVYMNIDEEGRGTMKVTRTVKQGTGFYLAEAPELLKAMQG